ncbi:hypothetical protein HDC95_002383 [Microbacterium sp. AK031]|nr:hypothetical protein [Microbacterium sp. AK031]MCS3844085.1 hypothetical protein [Microbacterium sp. AK031]
MDPSIRVGEQCSIATELDDDGGRPEPVQFRTGGLGVEEIVVEDQAGLVQPGEHKA